MLALGKGSVELGVIMCRIFARQLRAVCSANLSTPLTASACLVF